MEGMNIQQVGDLELANALLTHGLLGSKDNFGLRVNNRSKRKYLACLHACNPILYYFNRLGDNIEPFKTIIEIV